LSEHNLFPKWVFSAAQEIWRLEWLFEQGYTNAIH
jgi:hypothetical protein